MLPFMDYLRNQSAVEESAPLLVAWLDLLTGMAAGEEGASTVFASLTLPNAGKQKMQSMQKKQNRTAEICIGSKLCLVGLLSNTV